VAQLEKLIARLRRRPPQVDFRDICQLLEAYGWRLDRETGSHALFVKPEERSISVPKVSGRTVKRVYIIQVLERLGLGVSDGD
jgi:predicted RNA binding protein YcfA (HicA-like mRNA interferase family)